MSIFPNCHPQLLYILGKQKIKIDKVGVFCYRRARKNQYRTHRLTMSHPSFKYDVAFSFLRGDEDLVVQIRTLLEARVKTIIPSRKEELIADTDFEQRVNRLFGLQARIVAVLYRDSWGRTGSSLLEKTAIRNRAHEEGYDFVHLIPLEPSPSLPPWLPKRQVWLGYDRWGADGAAAVIEARVQQAGGTARGETSLERARRIEHEMALEEARQRFLHSQEGVRSAQSELSKLFDEIERISKEITKATQKIPIRSDRDEKHLILSSHGFSLEVAWFLRSSNTLEQSPLHIMLWRGLLSVHGATFEKPRRLDKAEFSFDRNLAGGPGWQESEGEGRFLNSAELAEEWLNLFLEQVRKNQLRD